MKKLKLALIGFGNVGKEFARILLEKKVNGFVNLTMNF